AAARRTVYLRAPGRLALLLGDRSTSLTRSLRVSNARFRAASGWAPRYPSARDGWPATATVLERRQAQRRRAAPLGLGPESPCPRDAGCSRHQEARERLR